jgi:hypothetical protein
MPQMPDPRIELAQPLVSVRQPVQLPRRRVGYDDLSVGDPYLSPTVVDAAKALEDLPAHLAQVAEAATLGSASRDRVIVADPVRAGGSSRGLNTTLAAYGLLRPESNGLSNPLVPESLGGGRLYR